MDQSMNVSLDTTKFENTIN